LLWKLCAYELIYDLIQFIYDPRHSYLINKELNLIKYLFIFSLNLVGPSHALDGYNDSTSCTENSSGDHQSSGEAEVWSASHMLPLDGRTKENGWSLYESKLIWMHSSSIANAFQQIRKDNVYDFKFLEITSLLDIPSIICSYFFCHAFCHILIFILWNVIFLSLTHSHFLSRARTYSIICCINSVLVGNRLSEASGDRYALAL